jgi:hypothetical protein
MAKTKDAPEEKEEGKGRTLLGWIKAGLVSLGGLLAGAAMMYASPLLDRVIKPNPPVANFQAESDGLKVVFHNRSTGCREGWWDFGDGTALEAFVPDQDVTHTFARPGAYTVKLTVKNLLGDANDRSVNLTLDGEKPAPSIDEFTVTPLQSPAYAPASFKVSAKYKNADVSVWCTGDDQALEVAEDAPAAQERMVTFNQPGTYYIRFVIFNGKQSVERKEKVTVTPQPAGVTTALVRVTYEAGQVWAKEKREAVVIHPPPGATGDTFAFTRTVTADQGFEITQAKLAAPPGAEVKWQKLEVSKDHRQATLTGELVRQGGVLNKNAPPPQWTALVVLTQERRGAMAKQAPKAVAMSLTVPGVTEVPLPAVGGGWVAKTRALDLELRRDGNVVWHGTQLPTNAPMTLTNNAAYNLTVTETADKLRFVVTPRGTGTLGN